MNDHKVINALTVDVEDWFHILEVAGKYGHESWQNLESRVQVNTKKLLRLFDEFNVKATFFVLGWIANQHPEIVRDISEGGHEIGTHGYGHRLIFTQSPAQLRDDIMRSIEIIADICNTPIYTYRAPGFSIRKENLWALRVIFECGIRIDCSTFPARRSHGGIPDFPIHPFLVRFKDGQNLIEFPISVYRIAGKRIPFSGGGYLRFFPTWFIKQRTTEANRKGQPVVVYLHPREVDPSHPRMAMNLSRKFKSYINIEHTESKARELLKSFPFGTITEAVSSINHLPARTMHMPVQLG